MRHTRQRTRPWRVGAPVFLAMLALGPGVDVAWGAKKIFTPKPRGAGETLDTDGGAKGKTGEVVVGRDGVRLVGRVLSIQRDGKLCLSGPQFVGKATIDVSALVSVSLEATRKDTDRDEALVSNGDRVRGQVVAITPDAVVLESGAGGTLKMARRMVRSLSLGGAGAYVLIQSEFDKGRITPWSVQGGGWSVVDGSLTNSSGGQRFGGPNRYKAVYARLEEAQAVTAEVKVQSFRGPPLYCSLAVMGDSLSGRYGGNSVFARVRHDRVELCCGRGGGYNTITQRQTGNQVNNAVLRLAYDPGSGKARAWLNTTDLGEHVVPKKPNKGRYVLFRSNYPCKVSSMRVLRGVVLPSKQDPAAGKDTDTVAFANKDRVSATSVALADGALVVTTGHGEFRPPIDKVGSILFRTQGRQRPRRRKGDVRVTTEGSRLTLRLDRLTGEHLVGTSGYLGEVKLRRDAVKKIEFDIYK